MRSSKGLDLSEPLHKMNDEANAEKSAGRNAYGRMEFIPVEFLNTHGAHPVK
jgi:hypothetical protein